LVLLVMIMKLRLILDVEISAVRVLNSTEYLIRLTSIHGD
jgi:hypothetical protein